jgi:hypothetical protein
MPVTKRKAESANFALLRFAAGAAQRRALIVPLLPRGIDNSEYEWYA